MKSISLSPFLFSILLLLFSGCDEEDSGADPGPDPDPVPVEGLEYYISPSGSDMNPGTFQSPWLSWEKAIDMAKPGDVVYFMGGVYYMNSSIQINPDNEEGKSGDKVNRISFVNYQGETPVFDFSQADESSAAGALPPLSIKNAHFLNFEGLIFRNYYQGQYSEECLGISADNCSNLRFEGISISSVGGTAFAYSGADISESVSFDSTYFVHCDAYNNGADGWKIKGDASAFINLEGCRSWANSGSGFEALGSFHLVLRHCWSFYNGSSGTDGDGFVVGGETVEKGYKSKIVVQCISAGNAGRGFFLMEDEGYLRAMARFYNNNAYANTTGFTLSGLNPDHTAVMGEWINNISFQNLDEGTNQDWFSSGLAYTESNNTWDGKLESPGFVPSALHVVDHADFMSLDMNQLYSSRMMDGSLPDINFMRLVRGSDLVDAGLDVGLVFNGVAPDIGAHESSSK